MAMNEERTTLTGTVFQWTPPKINDNGRPVPGRLLAHDQDGEVFELDIWNDAKTGGLPHYIDGIDMDNIVGRTVRGVGKFNKIYNDVPQYSAYGLQVLQTQDAPTAKVDPKVDPKDITTAPVPADKPKPVDVQRHSIESQTAAKAATELVCSTGASAVEFYGDVYPLWDQWFFHIRARIQDMSLPQVEGALFPIEPENTEPPIQAL